MPKTKRLTSIDFSGDTAHIALCAKEQGVANAYDKALILKAKTLDPIASQIEKAKVQVTLPFDEFLVRFFGMWCEDAKVVSLMLGMDEPEEEIESDDYEDYYENYINEKVKSFTILKSLNATEDANASFESLVAVEKLQVLNDQAMLEKAIDSYSKKKKKSKATSKTTQKETPAMSTDTVSKSEFEAISKSLEEQKTALAKALETAEVFKAKLEKYETEQKAMISKARKDSITEVVKNEAHADALFANLETLSDETFVSTMEVIKSLATAAEKIEKSRLFDEIGASGDAVAKTNSAATQSLVEKALRKELNIK